MSNADKMVGLIQNAPHGPEGWRSWDHVRGELWSRHYINVDGAHRALKRAEVAGLVEVKKPKRNRADTWMVKTTSQVQAPDRAAWTLEGQRYAHLGAARDHLRHKVDGSYLLVSAYAETQPPLVSDGWEVCVHVCEAGSRSPVWPVLSCASFAEAEERAAQIRRKLRAGSFHNGTLPGAFGRFQKDAERMMRELAGSLGYVEDHHIVWHRSGAWLDRESYGGKTWRQAGHGRGQWGTAPIVA